jgi:hypothetical protein
VPCIPKGASSLKDGDVSIIFHVPYEHSAKAFSVHDIQGTPHRLMLFPLADDEDD